MKTILITLFLAWSLNLSAQEIATFQDEIPTQQSSTIVISMDSSNVLVKYWDADYILVSTDLAYHKEERAKVFETAPVNKFGLENRKEAENLLFREKEIYAKGQTYGAIGQFHTLYLPYSIESIEWVVNIPSSL